MGSREPQGTEVSEYTGEGDVSLTTRNVLRGAGAVPSRLIRDVHRIGRTAHETIAFSHQCSQTIALYPGDLVKHPHTNQQSDARQPMRVYPKKKDEHSLTVAV